MRRWGRRSEAPRSPDRRRLPAGWGGGGQGRPGLTDANQAGPGIGLVSDAEYDDPSPQVPQIAGGCKRVGAGFDVVRIRRARGFGGGDEKKIVIIPRWRVLFL